MTTVAACRSPEEARLKLETACNKILSGGDPFGADAPDGAGDRWADKIEDIANNTREIEEKCQEIWAGPDTLNKIADFAQERHYGD